MRDDIVVPGITALRHVTRSRENYESDWAAEAQVKCQTLIPTAIKLLQPELSTWQAIKATLGFIRNISNNKRNRAFLR